MIKRKEKAIKKPRKKHAKLRIKIEEFALVVIFAAIGVGTIFFGSYAIEKYEMNQAEQGLFSSNVFVLAVRGVDENLDFTEKADITQQVMDFIEAEGDVVVYQRLIGLDIPWYAVAFSGQLPTSLRVTYGRYFEESDFGSGKYCCVIGKDLLSNVTRQDGVNYFNIGTGHNWEVVGSIGYPVISDINSTILYNMDCYGAYISQTEPFIIDFVGEGRKEELKEKFNAILTEADVTVVELEVPESVFTVSGFFNMELLNLIMLIFACFCVVLSTVPLTLFWAERRRKRVAVQRMLGFSASFTLWRMFGRLMILFHLGFLLSYGVYFIIAQFGYLNLKSFFSMEMLVAYLGALIFNILIAIVPFVQTMRVEPGDALRRE
ncbi:MAG TPA: hypothetical protein PK629_03405 [Oscillospiraceae bacterium]|nr:hypothetical protein [Oscillospiraceae bacterium]HPK34741.1 hypothetical protein [Oscillospiraceae bacterium]